MHAYTELMPQYTSLACKPPPVLINLTHRSFSGAHLCSCGRLQPSRAPSSPRTHAASVCSSALLPGGCPTADPKPETPPGPAPCRPPVAPASKPCKEPRSPAPAASPAVGLWLAAGSRTARRRAATCSSLSRSLAAAAASAASCNHQLMYHAMPATIGRSCQVGMAAMWSGPDGHHQVQQLSTCSPPSLRRVLLSTAWPRPQEHSSQRRRPPAGGCALTMRAGSPPRRWRARPARAAAPPAYCSAPANQATMYRDCSRHHQHGH